jgi:uncharacterized tellurite resistance protein B-like protein
VTELQAETARCLFRLAWADGHVNQHEVDIISGLLERLGLSLVERLAAMDAGLSAPQGAALEVALARREDRLQAMEMLVHTCFADGVAHPEEVHLLGDLAVRWGIGADELEQLRVKVMGGR